MEIYELGRLPKGLGTTQGFHMPPEIPFNNLGWLISIVAAIVAMVSIGIIWYSVALYLKEHNTRPLISGLIIGGFFFVFILSGALMVLVDKTKTQRNWLLKLDDRGVMINAGPYAIAPQYRDLLPGIEQIVAIPYNEIASVGALNEMYYYPTTKPAQGSDDKETVIGKIVCPILKIRLKRPAPPALRESMDTNVKLRQELAAGAGFNKLRFTPFYASMHLVDDQTIHVNWDPALSPDLPQALTTLAKHLPVEPEENHDIFPANPFTNTPAAWKELDVAAIRNYAIWLIEQGYPNTAVDLCYQFIHVEDGNHEGWLQQLVSNEEQARIRATPANFMHRYLTMVKWQPLGVVFPLFVVMAGIFLLFIQRQDWKDGELTKNWQSGQGKIITSQKTTGNQQPNIVYTYTVNGKELEGKTVTLASYRGRSNHPDSLLSRYPVGREVTVRFNPERPEQAVLEVVPPGYSLYGLFQTFGLIGGGLIAAVVVPFLL